MSLPSSPPPPAGTTATAEYRELRATIRERGTVRVVLAAAAFFVWAPLAAFTPHEPGEAWRALIPLVVLWAGFEVVYALHVGVERIGRYLQVAYEADRVDLPAWERTAMRLATSPGADTGADPLFFRLFGLAALINLGPLFPQLHETARVAGGQIQLVVVVVLHVAYALRLFQARRFAAGQRARDLHAFQTIRNADRSGPTPPA